MSYDVRIWSTQPLSLTETFPLGKWEIDGNLAYYVETKWQMIVTDSVGLEEEDIPEEVLEIKKNIKYLIEVIVEPMNAISAARPLLKQVVNDIAKNTDGVIEDPQANTFRFHDGSIANQPKKQIKDERFSVLEISWWFNEIPGEKKTLFQNLIEYFEKKLPEALPRRYGLYEPPQYKYLETGKQHFIDFMGENDSVVWYPSKPVLGMHISLVSKPGVIEQDGKAKFVTNHFSIAIDSAILAQTNRQADLEQLLKEVSKIIKPFYGEARLLRDYIYGGASYFADSKSEWHPVRAGRWIGIPQTLPQALVVGKPYLELWPLIKDKGELIEDLCFISVPDWKRRGNVGAVVGGVPADIAQLSNPKYLNLIRRLAGQPPVDYSEIYPKKFPFKDIKLA